MNALAKVLFDDFETWIQKHGPQVSARTARRYRATAEDFGQRFGHPSYADQEVLTRWYEDTVEGVAASTVNVKIAALRALFGYMKSRGARDDDPTQGLLKMRRVPRRMPRPIPHDGIRRVLSEVRGALALQDTAMIEVLYGSGLRREEAATLRLENIIDSNRLRIVGKGDKERVTIITDPEWVALVNWITYDTNRYKYEAMSFDERVAYVTQLRQQRPRHPIFRNAQGRPLVDLKDPGHYIYMRWRRVARRAGVQGSPHSLRHSFGTELANGGADIYGIKQAMGHDDIRTTEVYVEINARGLNALKNAHTRQYD